MGRGAGIRRHVAGAFLVALLAAPASPALASAEPPRRIVSTQLCADQLLLLLADRGQIAALSYFAADPNFAGMASAAEGLPRTRGLAEEVLPLDPDVVFVGAFSARPLTALLRRLGKRVVELPVATDFAGIRRNVRQVAAVVGWPYRGERLIQAFDAVLATTLAARSGSRPVAALYWSKGYTPARASLAAEAARLAGFVDLGTALGHQGAARVPLETLIAAAPDLVVTSARGPAALADLPTRHPALDVAFGPSARMSMPHHLWICGAPIVADAVGRLRARRTQMFGK